MPEEIGSVVREAETRILAPALEELGFALPDFLPPRQVEEAPPLPPRRDIPTTDSRSLLANIRVEPETRRGYDRSDWPHWLDLDGDCLDARDEVLQAESLDPVRLSPNGCDVVAGRWADLYTGETVTDPSSLDVDHFIPLQEAHDSGGHAWDRERRAAFANDLGDPRSLTAVTAAANRSKGAQGPEEWLPPSRSYRCQYVVDWIAVKARWDLSMDERERVTVGNLLASCGR